jgi:hypothetical protein
MKLEVRYRALTSIWDWELNVEVVTVLEYKGVHKFVIS